MALLDSLYTTIPNTSLGKSTQAISYSVSFIDTVDEYVFSLSLKILV